MIGDKQNGSIAGGVYAALLTPRLAAGGVDAEALKRLVGFLLSKGIHSFVVNGATGEFCLTDCDELRTILRTVKSASGSRGEILCGVGTAGSAGAIELAAIAEDGGAAGLLLPMPYFFRYQQQDLDAFSRTVASSTKLPVLLYNLPQFSSGLSAETVRGLIRDVPNIVGIKDSSGSLEILRSLNSGTCRIVGSDAVLAQALEEGICDGVVSGVACALPELVAELYGSAVGSAEFCRGAYLLKEFLLRLEEFPTPWGLKWAVEARGVAQASFSQPLSDRRREQGRGFTAWFREWLAETAMGG